MWGLPNDRRAKFLPSVVGFAYDLLRYECYLGNIGYCIQYWLSETFSMDTKQDPSDSSLFRKMITASIGGLVMVLAITGPATAAPQMLVLLDGSGRLPIQCGERQRVVELATMCLQPERRMPEMGRGYRPTDRQAVVLTGLDKSGRAVQRPLPEAARINALRSHLSVRVEISRAWVEETFAARPGVVVAGGAALRPLALTSDTEPLTQSEIRHANANAMTVARGAFAGNPGAVLSARISNYVINALPNGNKVSDDALATAWREALAEIPANPDDLSTVRFIVDYCHYSANNGLARSLHYCLQGRQDRALEELHQGYINALGTGS